MRGGSEYCDGQHHANGRKGERRESRLPQRMDRRAKAGFKQDDGERYRADKVGEARIVELNAEAVNAGRKPDQQEEKQKRRAEAEGNQARKPRREHQRGSDERVEIKALFQKARPKSAAHPLAAECGEGKAGCKVSLPAESFFGSVPGAVFSAGKLEYVGGGPVVLVNGERR